MRRERTVLPFFSRRRKPVGGFEDLFLFVRRERLDMVLAGDGRLEKLRRILRAPFILDAELEK
jgi:hypothetical protein